MRRQLFGTDGIRGVAGEFPLDALTVHAAGAALGAWAARHHARPEVVLGMDTRESGPWLAAQLAGGLARSGVGARFAGLITTPGIAYLARCGPYVAGVMISASHNPYQDNGIKMFDHSGFKLPDKDEHGLERSIFALRESGLEATPAALAVDEGLDRAYVAFLAACFQGRLEGRTIVVDCAHGSASFLAPDLFRRLGATVHPMGCQPDGRNINLGCGALDTAALREHVLERGADAGVAFDGDADRAILVSRTGRIVDGDAMLLVAARALRAEGRLRGNEGGPAVVATVMSNLGLERALARSGIGMVRTPVGDKYVLEEMVRSGANLGGEQSGHIIFRDDATTGDGLLTALRIFDIVARSGVDLDELTSDLEICPQVLVNVRVRHKRPLAELPAVGAEIQSAERAFGETGRIVVRFSGTEPLARVMVEGPDQARVEMFAGRIATAIRAACG